MAGVSDLPLALQYNAIFKDWLTRHAFFQGKRASGATAGGNAAATSLSLCSLLSPLPPMR
jgi:hypothetical protein